LSPQSTTNVSVTSDTWYVSSWSGPTLTGGGNYMACAFEDAGATATTLTVEKDTAGAGVNSLENNTFPTWPNPLVVTGSANNRSLYADYTSSGGGGSTAKPNVNTIFYQ
jgi:hypothetical protein